MGFKDIDLLLVMEDVVKGERCRFSNKQK